MKRKLGKNTVNPLDLLLDTTSNVFGSMILIAIMIALFAGNPSSNDVTKIGDVTSDTIERQILNAQKSAAILAADITKQKGLNGEKQGARELADIESEIDSVKTQLEIAEKSKRDGVQNAILDYSSTVAGATKDSNALQQEAEKEKNAIVTADEQLNQLQDRIKELQGKVKDERAKKTQRISLPRERETEQQSFWVIIINNEIFPASLIDSSGDLHKFESGITITQQDEHSELFSPIRGKGYSFPGAKNDITEQIRRLPRDRFVACLVFSDSIQTFRDFEEIVHNLGRDIGWQPCESESELVFSDVGGSHPNPQ